MLFITEFAIIDALYQRAGLAIPPLPASLEELPMRQVTSTTFSTAPLEGAAACLYASAAFLHAALAGKLPHHTAAYGFDGHGFTSQAIHYYITTTEVVILVQVSWGNYRGDGAAQRGLYLLRHKQALELAELAAQVAAAGAFPPERRLYVVVPHDGDARMAWAPHAPATSASETGGEAGAAHELDWSYPNSNEILYLAADQIRELLPARSAL